MAVILILYTVLNILVFGFVVLFARATRLRARPNERVDLEDNSIIAEEWDLIRCRQCVPSRCSRAVGVPPRPRKDVTCEICAALFMERYWQERLSGVPAAEAGGSRGPRDTGGAPTGLAEPRPVPTQSALSAAAPVRRERRDPTLRQLVCARRLYVVGLGCVVAGALIGALGNFIVPGYLLVITGVGLLIAGAATGGM
jgi:hypothetical protein